VSDDVDATGKKMWNGANIAGDVVGAMIVSSSERNGYSASWERELVSASRLMITPLSLVDYLPSSTNPTGKK